jgi:aminopeptidase N
MHLRHGTLALILPLVPFAMRLDAQQATRFAQDRPIDCVHIKLELNVNVEERIVTGSATLDLTALREVSSIRLDAVELDVDQVTVARDGHPAAEIDFVNDGKQLEIPLDEPLKTGEGATVKIEYGVENPRSGLHFFGPSEDEPDVPLVVWSQGESITNRYWFPSFDHPNERQSTEMIVTTRQGLSASSNGRLVSRTENDTKGTVTYHWLQEQPHVSYLVSLIVGDFHIERDSWRGKPVTYWVHPRYMDQVKDSFKNTIRMLDFFSDRIGIEYPWDRYAQICCEGFGGGMENTAATTLGNWTLHDKRSLLDSNSDGLIAHELAHQWWGDLLTCRDWAHIWLNEGFATYFEALWTEHDLGDDEFRYNMWGKAESAMRGGKDRPIVDRAYQSPDEMFDSRAYPKGAWVLHMIRKRLGDDLFWKALHKYGTDNALRTVETVDLRRAIEETTGQAFERFFYDWTERPGHPMVEVAFRWSANDKLAHVNVKQTQKEDAFHFPLELEFRFAEDTPPISLRREMTDKELSFYYPLPREPELVRMDPGQTVLMELKETKGHDLWRAQLLTDPDPIARIRAARHFGKSAADRDRRLLAKALQSESFWGVQREIAAALGDAGGDIARDALVKGTKLENHKARRACVEQLDSFRRNPIVIDAVRRIVENGDASYYVEAAAIDTYAQLAPDDAVEVLKRTLSRDSRQEVLRSAALRGLGTLGGAEVVPLLIEWTRPTKPRLARPSAIQALAAATRRSPLDEQTTNSIVTALAECLEDSGSRVRGAALQALGDLADPAKARSTLPALRALAANEPEFRLRDAAERTIKTIESGKPADVQFADLRKELKEARDVNEELTERVKKLEAMIQAKTARAETAEIEQTRP